jgi:micrococcal nuclease
MSLIARFAAVATLAALVGCGGGDGSTCGPTSGVVANIVDGDTIDLESGERIRYLMIDTPETTGGATDCFGENAKQFNSDSTLGETITIDYDVECEDRFGRLLAYISIGGREINSIMVDRGYACVLHIPPNGDDRLEEFEDLELGARMGGRGMWGICEDVTCD